MFVVCMAIVFPFGRALFSVLCLFLNPKKCFALRNVTPIFYVFPHMRLFCAVCATGMCVFAHSLYIYAHTKLLTAAVRVRSCTVGFEYKLGVDLHTFGTVWKTS